MDAQELHIASLVVHAEPLQAGAAAQAIATLPGAQVHAVSSAGKLVVTLEAPGAEAMTAAVAQVQLVAGVLSAALVYQCADTLEAMNQELDDAPA